jgi:hypothetical protein
VVQLDRFQMNSVPRLGGAMYRGAAVPAVAASSRGLDD